MMLDGMEDEDKWLAEGIAGIQHNAFYMHRALVHLKLSIRTLIFPGNPVPILTLEKFLPSQFTGREQSPRSPQVLCADAVGAPNLEAFSSQILRTL
jgi:hypothetical protein